MSHVFATSLTVRGYECGAGAVVALPTVLSHLEHCRWLWILEPRFGLVDLLREGHFFVVHRATLGLARTYGMGTSLTVRAALRRVGRVNCEVEQDLVRDDGVLLARARLDVIWLGPEGRMRRVPDLVRAGVTDEPMEARVAPPTGGSGFLAPPQHVFEPELARLVARDVPEHAAATPLQVRPSDCDVHEHVNNATYLRYFEDALGAPAAEADIEYRGQAHAGDVLTMRRWAVDDGRTSFALERGEEVLCRAVLTPR